jgi:dCTP deaminase
MSILSTEQIHTYLREEPDKALVITPLLEPSEQIDKCSVDLRLGNEFIVTRKTSFPVVDPTEVGQGEKKVERYQDKIHLRFHEEFVLHPNQLILGSTLEYIALPNDLAAYVTGRSSWGRLGLVIATASFIAPCWKGSITLELVNLGEAPLILFPGIRIAQLVLHKVVGEETYTGKYRCATGPEFARIHKDTELDFFGKVKTD